MQKTPCELHADTVAFEEKYGSQLELNFVLSIARWRLVCCPDFVEKLMRDIQMVLERWGAWAASGKPGWTILRSLPDSKDFYHLPQTTSGLLR